MNIGDFASEAKSGNILLVGVIHDSYGNPSTPLLPGGGRRRTLFACSRKGARGAAFVEPANSETGGRSWAAIVRPVAARRVVDRSGEALSRICAADHRQR